MATVLCTKVKGPWAAATLRHMGCKPFHHNHHCFAKPCTSVIFGVALRPQPTHHATWEGLFLLPKLVFRRAGVNPASFSKVMYFDMMLSKAGPKSGPVRCSCTLTSQSSHESSTMIAWQVTMGGVGWEEWTGDETAWAGWDTEGLSWREDERRVGDVMLMVSWRLSTLTGEVASCGTAATEADPQLLRRLMLWGRGSASSSLFPLSSPSPLLLWAESASDGELSLAPSSSEAMNVFCFLVLFPLFLLRVFLRTAAGVVVGRVEWGRASFDNTGGLEVGLLTSNGAEGAASAGSKVRARCSSGASSVSATEMYKIQMWLTIASGKVC